MFGKGKSNKLRFGQNTIQNKLYLHLQGSRDNMSVIIVYFTDKPSSIKKQESLNNLEKIFGVKNRNQ